MKKYLMTIFVILSVIGYSQTPIQNFFSPQQMTITWIGIDATHLKIRMSQPEKFKQYFFDYCLRMNKDVATNHNRYYFPIAYRKEFTYNTAFMDSLNKAPVEDMEPKKSVDHLEISDIKQIVAAYQFPESMAGIGILFIYDGISEHGNDYAKIWMVVYDLTEKQAIFIQKDESGMGGKTFEERLAFPALSMLRTSKNDYTKWAKFPEKFNLLNK